jgi:hypothetical protein
VEIEGAQSWFPRCVGLSQLDGEDLLDEVFLGIAAINLVVDQVDDFQVELSVLEHEIARCYGCALGELERERDLLVVTMTLVTQISLFYKKFNKISNCC